MLLLYFYLNYNIFNSNIDQFAKQDISYDSNSTKTYSITKSLAIYTSSEILLIIKVKVNSSEILANLLNLMLNSSEILLNLSKLMLNHSEIQVNLYQEKSLGLICFTLDLTIKISFRTKQIILQV